MYPLKFCKNGKVHADDLGLLDPDAHLSADVDARQDGGYFSRHFSRRRGVVGSTKAFI